MAKRRLLLRRRALETAEANGLIFDGSSKARLKRGAPDLVFRPVSAEIEESIAKCGSIPGAVIDLRDRGLLPEYADPAHLRRWLKSRSSACPRFRHVENGGGMPGCLEKKGVEMKEISDAETRRLLSLIEKSGGMKQKNGRLSKGVLHLVLEPKRGKVSELLAAVPSKKQAYSILKALGELPGFLTYKQFYAYFSKRPAGRASPASQQQLSPCQVEGSGDGRKES